MLFLALRTGFLRPKSPAFLADNRCMLRFTRHALVATLACAALGASPARAQLGPAQASAASRPVQASSDASAALQSLHAAWADVSAATLTLQGPGARANLTIARDGSLAWRWYDTTLETTANVPSDRTPDSFLYFAQSSVITRRGTHDAAHASTRANHYIITQPADLWEVSPGPSQLLLCPWPRISTLAKALQSASDLSLSQEADRITASSASLGAALAWHPKTHRILSMQRTSMQTQLAEEASYAYANDAQTRALPTSIAISVRNAKGEEAELKQNQPDQAQRWTVTASALSTESQSESAQAELRFDPARWSMLQFDPATSKLAKPDGTVVGGELNTSIAGLTDHIERSRASSYDKVAKWGGIACLLLVLGVAVDFARRRL